MATAQPVAPPPGARPLLQLLHVSDLHFWAEQDGKGAAQALRWLLTRWGSTEAAQGIRGHDAYAWTDLIPSFSAPMLADGWKGPTWLVATGDLTTWGDDVSRRAALGLIRAAARKLAIPFCAMYGNHDVWPGKGLPLYARPASLARRRSRFRKRFFPLPWPLLPVKDQTVRGRGTTMVITCAGSGRRLVGLSLNTVLHGRISNTFAWGRVRRDYYWQRLPPRPRHQIRMLRGALKLGDIGLVFTHHPLHYPGLPPASKGMILLNAAKVAGALLGSTTVIVISGHTHAVYPPPTQLPPATNMYSYPPLNPGHTQLIGGTATQLGATEKRWERLRFFEDPGTGRVWFQRVIFEHRPLLRRFEQVARGGQPVVEWAEIH